MKNEPAMTMKTDLASPAVSVDIEGVNLSYGDNHVLKSVDLSIRPGEFFAFLGPSGCGKTTLLRLIAGFNQAETGRVLVGGKDVSGLPPWKRDVGMVFQSYALWPHMTVARNVAFGLEERGVPRAETARRVAQALDLVGLGHLANVGLRSSRAGSSSGSRWRGRSRSSRRSCCWTSRSPISTPRCGFRSGANCATCSSGSA